MNLILESPAPAPYFTDMKRTLCDAGILAADFDWYISDLDTNFHVPALGTDDIWIQGTTLAQALEIPGLQFVWAVFSAFPAGDGWQDVESPPVADGNGRYWLPPEVTPQLQGARFEIVCWDSSATILVGLNHEQANRYLCVNPDAKALSSTWPPSAA